MRTTVGAFAIIANDVLFGWNFRIAVVCGAGGGLVYLVAAQFRVFILTDCLPPYGGVAVPILQQVRDLAAGKLCLRFGGDACDGTAGTAGIVGKVVTVEGSVKYTTSNFGGSVFVRIVTVLNGMVTRGFSDDAAVL